MKRTIYGRLHLPSEKAVTKTFFLRESRLYNKRNADNEMFV